MSLYLGNNLVSGVVTPIEPTRNIGQIIQSTLPLNDAGLHLLDGSLISGNGIYSDFYDYMVEKWQTYPQIFAGEQDWQSHVSTYGICGKFVLDEVNRTVRLPLITGFIEGTNSLADLEKFTQAGLPNVKTNSFGTYGYGSVNGGTVNGIGTDGVNNNCGTNGGSGGHYCVHWIDLSSANSIYGRSNTVQPQSIKVLYYIVIATSTKTDVEVDIDQIATDLSHKVDKLDLATVHCVIETYVNGTSWYRVYSDGWCEQGGGNITTSGNVNFLKPFINTNYCLVGSIGYGVNSNTWEHYDLQKTSTDYFYQNCCFDGYRLVSWYACGYIR